MPLTSQSEAPSATHKPPATTAAGAVGSGAAAGVALRSVSKHYGAVTAIENLTLDIPAGSYCCLLGPSGCGKTTALRLISGHEVATSGQVMIGDRIVNDLPAAKRNTAMMFQNYALFPHKTVWENIEFGLKMRRVPKAERRRRVGEILDLVGLAQTASRKPHQLSGGQQQRIALARALVTRPQVLMLDEPLSALDENLRVRMRGELRKIQKQFALTFIQVTHHVEEAFSLSDQVVVMNHGHIDQVATPSVLFAAPASQFVAKFIGDNNIFKGRVTGLQPLDDTYPQLHLPALAHKRLIEISVEGLGPVYALGEDAQIGDQAACCVRPDLVAIAEGDPDGAEAASAAMTFPAYASSAATCRPTGRDSPDASLATLPVNRLSARIVQAELTGYVTRVSLFAEATGQTLLHTLRTADWTRLSLQEGERVSLIWSAADCVFLPH